MRVLPDQSSANFIEHALTSCEAFLGYRYSVAETAKATGKRQKVERQQSKSWKLDKEQFGKLTASQQVQIAKLANEEADERKELPGSIKKLTKGYEMRVWCAASASLHFMPRASL